MSIFVARQTIEQKLQSFAQWVDILDFLKTYDITFSTGFLFRSTHILERINLDVELRDKAREQLLTLCPALIQEAIHS